MSQRLRLPRGDYNYWDIETAFYRENTFLIPRKLASPLSSDGWLTVILDSGAQTPSNSCKRATAARAYRYRSGCVRRSRPFHPAVGA